MSHKIKQTLEGTPQELKTVFRIVQTSQEEQDFEHGDAVALYNETESRSGETIRYAKLGRYDGNHRMVEIEYMMVYETGKQRFGSSLNFERKNPSRYQGTVSPIPDENYEEGLETLHKIV